MVYLIAFFIVLLTAATGAMASGFFAALATKWYHVTTREGAAGYFVAAFGLLGIIAGVIVAIVCCCFIPPDTGVRFFKAAGLSLGIMVFLPSAVGAISWAMADIPPKIAGETLFLIIEARYPEKQTSSPAAEPGDAYVTLGSIRLGKHIIRKSVRGPIWKSEATQVDGRWVVRGAVDVFTSRGKRFLAITLSPELSEGFLIPLPRWPGKKSQKWSNWLPRPRRDGKPSFNQVTYRFRVQRWSEPMKIEKMGGFEITTITSDFFDINVPDRTLFGSRDTYEISHHGKRLTFGPDSSYQRLDTLITFPSPKVAIMVRVNLEKASPTFFLLTEQNDQPKIELVSEASDGRICDIANDSSPTPYISYYQLPSRRSLDRESLYRIGWNGVLDTRKLKVYQFNRPSEYCEIDSVPPLGLSPDERSFIHFTYIKCDSEKHALAVFDFLSDRCYFLPIDRLRMPYADINELAPAWVSQRFAWQRDADGIDQLVERKDL